MAATVSDMLPPSKQAKKTNANQRQQRFKKRKNARTRKLMELKSIIRRLSPVETCRLMGFNGDEKKHSVDYIGRRYSRLVVTGYGEDYVSRSGKHFTTCKCLCDCGVETTVRASSLSSGLTKSCGCLSREKARVRLLKHGLHGDALYTTWKGMRERCNNPKQISHALYHDRGISVCNEWNDFSVFREWAISHGWTNGLTIDRIDNDKGYSPENCRVVTVKENNDNRVIGRDKQGRYVSVRKGVCE